MLMQWDDKLEDDGLRQSMYKVNRTMVTTGEQEDEEVPTRRKLSACGAPLLSPDVYQQTNGGRKDSAASENFVGMQLSPGR